jgi:hypothetical protein
VRPDDDAPGLLCREEAPGDPRGIVTGVAVLLVGSTRVVVVVVVVAGADVLVVELRRIAGVVVDAAAGRAARVELCSVVVGVVVDDAVVGSADALAATGAAARVPAPAVLRPCTDGAPPLP